MKTNYKSWKDVPDGVRYRLFRNMLGMLGFCYLWAKIIVVALIKSGELVIM